MTQESLIIKIALNAWEQNISRTDKLITSLSDEQLMREISPGRNRGIYLLGHLVAVHDASLQVLGIGERKYAHLDKAFIQEPDKSGLELPALDELRSNWAEQIKSLNTYFNGLTVAEWFSKHTAISDEDFAREPHRNKLSVLLTRTNHLSYHFGQLALLKHKED